ncbi:MAG: DUF2461 domain-containing protein [Erythrobacter sp.]|nr:DUF2461 domain-containing protein [Erythrobacter sp.]
MLSQETSRFIRDLADNNDRDWFKAHEGRYKEHYKLAGEAFAETLAARLGESLGSSFVARNFRIFRDVRFSKDKTPYNPHLRIGFSRPDGPADQPFLMTGLQRDTLTVGVGRFGFEKATLERFRQLVAGDEGDELAALLSRLVDDGARLSEPDLKRVPAPYDKDHRHADLLKHKGLAVWRDFEGHELAYGEGGIANVAAQLLKLRPAYDWLWRLVV